MAAFLPLSQTPIISDFDSPRSTAAERGDARRFEHFCQYGNFTMAYATLQPGMKYFEAHDGYLAYDSCLGTNFVLGDPVAPAERHAAIIEDIRAPVSARLLLRDFQASGGHSCSIGLVCERIRG